MTLTTNMNTALNDTADGPGKPGLATAANHMAGMLWYEMLSELNQNGFGKDALGAGGAEFQSLFLWNLAQNDFGKYDAGLAQAALRQVGGPPNIAPANASAAPADASPPVPQAIPVGDAADTDADATLLTIPPGALTTSTRTASALTTSKRTASTLTTSALATSALAASALAKSDLLSQAENFAKTIWPQIKTAAQRLGVPSVAVLAQTALETGWGTAAPGHNLFGIKALDGEPGTTRATQEMQDGILVPQTAAFRDYPDDAASVADYTGQIESGFQAVLGQNTVAGFAAALQQGGYATDTNYAAKIINIAQSPLMAQVLQAVRGGPESDTAVQNSVAKAGEP